MSAIIQFGLEPVAVGIYVSGSALGLGCAGISCLTLWGGRKVLEQQYKPDGSEKDHLTQLQKIGLKVAGHALIVIGIFAGLIACGFTSFVFAPFAVGLLGSLVGATTIHASVFTISSVAFLALTLTGLALAARRAYS